MPPPTHDKERGAELHRRLLAGDETATLDIAEAYYAGTLERLARDFPHDFQLVEEIVQDIFESYFTRPEQFDPAKSSLRRYLYKAGWGDLANKWKTEKRRLKIISLTNPVGFGGENAEYIVEPADPAEMERDIEEEDSPVWQKIAQILPNPVDQRMARLILDEVRSYEPFAKLLKITHLPLSEQQKEVRQHKDRITKALKRRYPLSELKNHE